MKIACQENKVPGDTFQEKVDNLERFGFAGVELMHGHLAERLSEVKQALSNSSVQASTICTGNEHDLLGVTKDDRAARMERFKGLLALAGELGLVGVIAVPVRGRTPIFPDLSPYQSGADLERHLYVELLREAGESAEREGTNILVEPLNRYETHLANTLGRRRCHLRGGGPSQRQYHGRLLPHEHRGGGYRGQHSRGGELREARPSRR